MKVPLEDVTEINCGKTHTVVKSKGVYYGFGDNQKLQLSFKKQKEFIKPIKIDSSEQMYLNGNVTYRIAKGMLKDQYNK